MGLLSNRLDRESLKPGDHIYSWRAAYIYAHHGIYLGDDRVVHFTRLGQEVGTGTGLDVLIIGSMPPPSLVTCPSCNHTDISNGVISSCLECFLNGGLLYRFEYSVNPAIFLARPRGGTCTLAASDPPETVINRANHLVKNGFGCYNILKNNCIHFAIYCKTGLLHVSDKRTMSPSGLAASIIVRPVHAIFSSTLKGVKVASSVAACRVSRYDDGIGKKGDAVKFKKGS